MLIEFPAGQTPSLLDLGGMQVELSEMFGREVDLKTPGFLSPTILQRVLTERQVQYARVNAGSMPAAIGNAWSTCCSLPSSKSPFTRFCEEPHFLIQR